MAITLTLALLTIGIGTTKRRFNTNNLGAESGLLFEDMTAKEEAEAGHDMWVKSAKAGFQKLYDVFEEKIFPKEKKEEKPVHFHLTYTCDRCLTSVKHEAYMKKGRISKGKDLSVLRWETSHERI